MEQNSKNTKLFIPFLLLSTGAALEVVVIISNFFMMTDFTKGFISGIAITLLLFGLILLALSLLKRSR